MRPLWSFHCVVSYRSDAARVQCGKFARHNENVSGEEIMRNCCSCDKELREKRAAVGGPLAHSTELHFIKSRTHSLPLRFSLLCFACSPFSPPCTLLWVPVLAHAVSYTKCYLAQQAPLEWKILITRAHCRSFPTNRKDAELHLLFLALYLLRGGVRSGVLSRKLHATCESLFITCSRQSVFSTWKHCLGKGWNGLIWTTLNIIVSGNNSWAVDIQK